MTSAEFGWGLVVERGYLGDKDNTMCFQLWEWIDGSGFTKSVIQKQ